MRLQLIRRTLRRSYLHLVPFQLDSSNKLKRIKLSQTEKFLECKYIILLYVVYVKVKNNHVLLKWLVGHEWSVCSIVFSILFTFISLISVLFFFFSRSSWSLLLTTQEDLSKIILISKIFIIKTSYLKIWLRPFLYYCIFCTNKMLCSIPLINFVVCVVYCFYVAVLNKSSTSLRALHLFLRQRLKLFKTTIWMTLTLSDQGSYWLSLQTVNIAFISEVLKVNNAAEGNWIPLKLTRWKLPRGLLHLVVEGSRNSLLTTWCKLWTCVGN